MKNNKFYFFFRVFKLLCALYDHQSGLNEVAEVVMERQRQIVDRFVQLLCSGMAITVLVGERKT